jgi:hypothetical protein
MQLSPEIISNSRKAIDLCNKWNDSLYPKFQLKLVQPSSLSGYEYEEGSTFTHSPGEDSPRTLSPISPSFSPPPEQEKDSQASASLIEPDTPSPPPSPPTPEDETLEEKRARSLRKTLAKLDKFRYRGN